MFVLRNTVSKKLWYPDYIANSVSEIDFELLKKAGVKACLIDLDGTVVSTGKFEVDDDLRKRFKKVDIPLYIATNRPKSRDLKNLKNDLSAQGVIHPQGFFGKPLKRYFVLACRQLGLKPNQVVMIGDRILQDIIGANRSGLKSVWVYKLGKSKGWIDERISAAELKLANKIKANSYKKLD